MLRIRTTTLTLAMVATFASHAAAFDLTGTWIGTRKCQDLVQGVKEKFTDPATFQVTQTGDAIGIFADFGAAGTTNYTGLANFLVAKPDKGEFAMIHCGTNDIVGDNTTYDSVGRMQVTTKADKVKATLKGTTIFSDAGTTPPSLGTCKWSLKRTDATDTGVSTTCPSVVVSRRAYKKNIQYLSDVDLKRLGDALLGFHLASYQYNMPGASPGTHLGFIIDDVAPSPSVAADGNTVDLYGYTSMTVAAVQTQAREIEVLKREVASLQKQVPTRRSRATTRR